MKLVGILLEYTFSPKPLDEEDILIFIPALYPMVTYIQLIDDDLICNYMHKRLIQSLDLCCEVKVARNGYEGIQQILESISNKAFPKIIFLDLNMPVMNGLEFLEEFKKIEQLGFDSPIVILSTSEYFKDIEKIRSARNCEIITKPLTRKKLVAVFKKHFPSKYSQKLV